MTYRTSFLVVVLNADDSEHLRRTLPSDFQDEPKLVVKADGVLTSALACELFKVQSLPRSDVTLVRGLPKETDLLPVLLDDGRREAGVEIGVSIEPPHVVVAKLQDHES
jgi:hypothetical protein